MDINNITESLRLAAQAGPYWPLISAQVEAASEFEKLVSQVRQRYHLENVYSVEEVKLACQEVCVHWPAPSMRTMGILVGGQLPGELDVSLARGFFSELGKLGQKAEG